MLETKSRGIEKYIPLSKLPSPNSNAEISVFVAKKPKVKPDLKVFDKFKVIPESFAKYLPPERIIFTPSSGVSQIKFKCPVKVS